MRSAKELVRDMISDDFMGPMVPVRPRKPSNGGGHVCKTCGAVYNSSGELFDHVAAVHYHMRVGIGE